ncbi:2-oxo acid dehydrogenase subunit E2 [Halostagnicola kamekurae]|uniref:Pyruvate dehydrogenase E2 component (Dihydrolipoamide acetyltransferase) n=1 Tax=Halostagnicola kamekurae TaxID=619731 RepID=A0A1I6U4N7_9EURY|nr:pyruvate dehydrogenase E2 component (dihydrolipoamide acetyltransferase) [Halostagnicola kamekurae]
MVSTAFELPDVGEGVAEGELVTWLIDPGDRVAEDQPIATVETDKALVEIPSPYDGVVAEHRGEEGETIQVGEPFVVFDVDESELEQRSSSSTESSDDTTESNATGTDGETESERSSDGEGESEASSGEVTESVVPADSGRVFAPPSVRRLARELGVEPAAVCRAVGAADRRLTESDVHAFADGHAESSEPPARERLEPERSDSVTRDSEASASSGSATVSRSRGADRLEATERPEAADRLEQAGRDRTLAMPATRRLAREHEVDIDDVPASERRDGDPFVTPEDVDRYARGDESAAGLSDPKMGGSGPEMSSSDSVTSGTDGAARAGPGDRIPYAGVRRTIGEQMATSKYTAPHVSHHDEVEVSALVEVRSRLKSSAAERGTDLTYLPFAVKAVVAGLKEVPAINAELDEENEEIVLHDEYNIGIAVASDAGLMVPVIDDADQKGLLELADEIGDKAERARDRSIGLEEMQGGTFTITNVGAIGGEYVSPIINYPEAGILALGSLKERPWAEDGEVVARETLPISMSVDHRIVDGAEAARFTNEVKRYLNDPELLLLE